MEREAIIQKLNFIFNSYFQYNLFLDDMVYAFESDFNMPRFADTIHKISHMMPEIADDIQGFVKKRGIKLHRSALQESSIFNSEKEWLEKAYSFSIAMEKLYSETISFLADESEFALEDGLREKLKGIQTDISYQFYTFMKGYDSLDQEGLSSLWGSEYLSYITINI